MEPFAFPLPVLVNLWVTLKLNTLYVASKQMVKRRTVFYQVKMIACSSRLTHELTPVPSSEDTGPLESKYPDEI